MELEGLILHAGLLEIVGNLVRIAGQRPDIFGEERIVLGDRMVASDRAQTAPAELKHAFAIDGMLEGKTYVVV